MGRLAAAVQISFSPLPAVGRVWRLVQRVPAHDLPVDAVGVPNGRPELDGTTTELEFVMSAQAKPTLLIP